MPATSPISVTSMRRSISHEGPADCEHVLSSRGAASSWLNLVSACKECNGRKADRTPEDAGMMLRIDPYDPMVSYRVGGHDEDLPVAA